MVCHKINPGLELRLLQPADAPALFALVDANRASLREWLPWVDATVKVADSAKFIACTLRERVATRAFASGIWSSGRLVGVIRHNRIDWAARIAFPGWWLEPGSQGRGIMTSCCRALFDHAFTQLRVHRIVVGVAIGNLRSETLVRRLGFTPLNTLSNAEWLNGRSVDHVIYSLLPAPGAPLLAGAAATSPQMKGRSDFPPLPNPAKA